MSFCKECGQALGPDAAFCRNCGAKASPLGTVKDAPSDSPASANLVEESEWELFFCAQTASSEKSSFVSKIRSTRNHCIVLTDRKALRESLGSSYPAFESALRMHCLEQGLKGWRYHFLDCSSNRFGPVSGLKWEAYVELLVQAVDSMEREVRVKPEAVFIVGDESIVPMAVFELPPSISGHDYDVDSDIPYSSLCTEDPFVDEGGLACKLAVGRLPVGSCSGAEVGINYFRSFAQHDPHAGGSNGFGLTAAVWEGASHEVARNIGQIGLNTSPDLSLLDSPDRFDSHARYLYFNVHGSDTEKHWVGDDGLGNSPLAVSPKTLLLPSRPNALATEACYGARFSGLAKEESVLFSALGHKTLAFSGSSRIAYGPANPPVGDADLVAMEFLSRLKAGENSGDSFVAARQSVLVDDYLTPLDVLSAVEFNLFGDPTLVFPSHPVAKSAAGTSSSGLDVGKSSRPLRDPLSSVKSSLTRSSGSLRMRMPDVLGDVKASLDATWAGIRDRLASQVYEANPALRGVEPTVTKLRIGIGRTESLQLAFAKKEGSVFLDRVLYADRTGKVKKELVAK